MNTEELLWYTKEAPDFNHALPIGNGRIGGMVFGGAAKEVIKLNEDSIYSGGLRNRCFPEIRQPVTPAACGRCSAHDRLRP